MRTALPGFLFMPKGYKAFTGALALTGSAGLLLTGELNPLVWLLVPAILIGYIRYLKGRPPLPGWFIGVSSVLAVFFFLFDAMLLSADILLAVAHLTFVFHALKSFDFRDPWDNLQVFFMALLQVVITSELTRSIAFGAIFLLFMASLVSAISIAHFIKEGTSDRVRLFRPVAAISLCAVIFTALFFVLIPRPKGGILSRRHAEAAKISGFNENVRLGAFGEVKLDPSVVMRVETGALPPYYFRGTTLDYFDGYSWHNNLNLARWPVENINGGFFIEPPDEAETPEKQKPVFQRISLEPLDTDVIFALEGVSVIESASRLLFRDRAGTIYMPEKRGRRVMYTALSAPGRQRPANEAAPYLYLPQSLHRVKELALTLTEGEQHALGKAARIEQYLVKNYSYSLYIKPAAPGYTPVEDFLFQSRQGFCEHYATAMALMLRAVGIPSRVVTGFSGGEYNPVGNYIIVRQRDAHTWVEAAIDGSWRMFDPTPPAAGAARLQKPTRLSLYLDNLKLKWYRYVVSFSSKDQMGIAKAFVSALKAVNVKNLPQMPEMRMRPVKILLYLPVPALAVFVFFILRGRKKGRHSFETLCYIRLKGRVKRAGGNIGEDSTALDVLREAERLGFDRRVHDFVRLYREARFGGKHLAPPERRLYKSLYKSLQPYSPTRGTKTQ